MLRGDWPKWLLSSKKAQGMVGPRLLYTYSGVSALASDIASTIEHAIAIQIIMSCKKAIQADATPMNP